MKMRGAMGSGGRAAVLMAGLVMGMGYAGPAARAQAVARMAAAEIPQGALAEPEALHAELAKGARPLILQVGSRMLFTEAHIPGSEYAGPGSQESGLETLRRRVEALPRSKEIVIYCGCCPWDRCPNIGPAWRTLHGMGFTKLRVLHIADNFGKDWVEKGYGSEAAQ